jgi:hypothetical protein
MQNKPSLFIFITSEIRNSFPHSLISHAITKQHRAREQISTSKEPSHVTTNQTPHSLSFHMQCFDAAEPEALSCNTRTITFPKAHKMQNNNNHHFTIFHTQLNHMQAST